MAYASDKICEGGAYVLGSVIYDYGPAHIGLLLKKWAPLVKGGRIYMCECKKSSKNGPEDCFGGQLKNMLLTFFLTFFHELLYVTD